MSRIRIDLVVFIAGLAAVCWIGAGYLVSNPLAAAVTLLIGACYLAGAFELRRYAQATGTLARAVAGLSEPPAKLDAWLDVLDPGLRGAVRARIEGARVGLPGPSLTPYLVGLLVLLGMLGTLLGMVVTLKGTGAALESATDLDAIRASLIAPVKGLGFAFGTSIAGVATSAMLGLLSALYRRERIDVARQLDAKIATTLRVHSHAHQRDESFRLLQRQADVMPALVDRLQTMMTTLEQRSVALHERQLENQQAFFDKTEHAYTRLASTVGQSLQDSAAESARAAGAALRPVMETTMTGLAHEMTALRDTVTHAVQRQLDGLSSGFETTTANVADTWNRALADHQRTSDAVAQQLRTALGQFTDTFAQRSTDLLGSVATRLETTEHRLSDAWQQALSRQEQAGETLASQHARALAEAAATFERHSASLLDTMRESHTGLQTELASRDEARLAAWRDSLASMAAKLGDAWEQASASNARRQQEIGDALAQTTRDLSAQAATFEQRSASLLDTMRESHTGLQTELASRDEQRLAAWNASLAAMAAKLGDEWQRAGVHSAGRQQEICDALAQTTRDLSAQVAAFEQRSASLLDTMRESHANVQTELASRDEQRLAAWNASLAAMAASLRDEWAQTSAQAATRQQDICDTLARTANDITAQAEAHARGTINEIGRLVQAASEAPKAAAEVVAELRQRLSDSMVRDTAMLEERSRLLATLETLLDAVNHASTEQRSAVDALVGTSADLLERVGARFNDTVDAETRKLDAVAAQVSAGAVEVASLGDAFGIAVHAFGESNDKLLTHLQRIEAALEKSLARSDEQLEYYVAQAREVIDLSMMSQKQIVEDLQQLAGRRAPVGA